MDNYLPICTYTQLKDGNEARAVGVPVAQDETGHRVLKIQQK